MLWRKKTGTGKGKSLALEYMSMSQTQAASVLAALLVRVIHIALIVWMIWAPFSDHDESLALHAITAPFPMLHWAMSNDQCALTVLEKKLRGLQHDDQSFIHSIVAPVYVISDASLRTIVFGTTFGLWLITLYRLHKRWNTHTKP